MDSIWHLGQGLQVVRVGRLVLFRLDFQLLRLGQVGRVVQHLQLCQHHHDLHFRQLGQRHLFLQLHQRLLCYPKSHRRLCLQLDQVCHLNQQNRPNQRDQVLQLRLPFQIRLGNQRLLWNQRVQQGRVGRVDRVIQVGTICIYRRRSMGQVDSCRVDLRVR